MTYEPDEYMGLPRNRLQEVREYDYRLHGYWRIGQSFQHRGRHDIDHENYSNDSCFLRGQLLQITFAPVWHEFEHLAPCKHDRAEVTDGLKTDDGKKRVLVSNVGPNRAVSRKIFNNRTPAMMHTKIFTGAAAPVCVGLPPFQAPPVSQSLFTTGTNLNPASAGASAQNCPRAGPRGSKLPKY